MARKNFPLASAILLSGKVLPGSLNFDGAEELLELLQRDGSVEDLQAAIKLGLHINMVPHEVHGDPMGIDGLSTK